MESTLGEYARHIIYGTAPRVTARVPCKRALAWTARPRARVPVGDVRGEQADYVGAHFARVPDATVTISSSILPHFTARKEDEFEEKLASTAERFTAEDTGVCAPGDRMCKDALSVYFTPCQPESSFLGSQIAVSVPRPEEACQIE